MEAIKKYYLNEEEDKLQEYNCERFVLIWEEILLMHSEKPYLSSLNEVKMVFEMLIQNQTLDFSGTAPLNFQVWFLTLCDHLLVCQQTYSVALVYSFVPP